MIRFFTWLSAHKFINIQLAIIYYISVVVFHDEVTNLAILLRRHTSVRAYNFIFAALAVTLLIIIVYFLGKNIVKKGKTWSKLIYLISTLIFILILSRYFMVYSIESVHFFQYAILFVLLFPLLRSYGEAVFIATVLGIIDEIYQYTVLVPTFAYFDFNDMLLNLAGAGLGASWVYIMTGAEVLRNPWYKKPSFYIIIIVTISLLVLTLIGEFALYPYVAEGSHSPWITLNRAMPEPHFWSKAYGSRMYHVLLPGEGFPALCLLIIFYYFMDFFADKKSRIPI